MVKVIVIKKNNFNISQIQDPEDASKLSLDKFLSVTQDYLSIEDLHDENHQEYMEKMALLLEMHPEKHKGETKKCSEDPNEVYLLTFLQDNDLNGPVDLTPEQIQEEKQQGLNRLATVLNITHEVVVGNAIFVANKQPIEDYSVHHHDVTLEDIFRILQKRCQHVGWVIKSNKEKVAFKFNNEKKIIDHTQYQEMWDSEDYAAEEFPLLDHKLMLFRKRKDRYQEGDKFNLLATRLYGKTKIRGDMIVVSMISENLADDITPQEMDLLLQACYGRLSDRVIPPEKQEEERDELGRVMIKNKFRHLFQHVKHQKISCNLCQALDCKYYCGSCGRIKYCSVECQRKDWTYHRNNCLR